VETINTKHKQLTEGTKILSGTIQAVLLALGVYLLWVAATYLLEGRINLVHNPTPTGRAIYVLIANVVIGIGLAFWTLRTFVKSNVAKAKQLGFRSLNRTIIAGLIALVVGGGLFLLQNPLPHTPLVLFNGFAQVLPVSIAEVVVCWAVIGSSFEAWAQSKGKVIGVIVGIVAADFLFGIYHFAHSAPFNQTWMVFFLMIPGLVTSLVYFFGRDIYAAIIFHNFLGMTGVMQNVDLERFSQPLYPLYVLMVISVLALIAADIFFIRRLTVSTYHAR
jgi:hypothetical protein